LICAVELCSLHLQYGWDPDRVVTNAIFADGAGAVVARASSAQRPQSWIYAGGGTHLVEDSADAMTWKIGDNGFLMTLSPKLPDLIDRQLPGWIDRWIRQFGYRRETIKNWAIHPGGPRILSATEKALAISPDLTKASKEVLAENGNMSSATLIYVLEKMINEDFSRPCVALGFGPGLTIEAALFE
jgi:predicted naringenin-chalcone synthase